MSNIAVLESEDQLLCEKVRSIPFLENVLKSLSRDVSVTVKADSYRGGSEKLKIMTVVWRQS